MDKLATDGRTDVAGCRVAGLEMCPHPRLTVSFYVSKCLANPVRCSFRFTSSLHLAVYLLDFFMDNFDVSRNQLNLVAMGCLSVSSKFEEKEEDIPKQNVLRLENVEKC